MDRNGMKPGYYNMDCMEGMAKFPDKFFDLAIVDPPYGGGATEKTPVNDMLSGGGARKAGSTANADDSVVAGLTDTTLIRVTRTGGTWARKYQRERRGRTTSGTGMSLRLKPISQSWRA